MGLFNKLKKGYLKTAIEFEEKAASKRMAKAQAREAERRELADLEKKHKVLKNTGRTSPVKRPKNNSKQLIGALNDVGNMAANMLESQENYLYGSPSQQPKKKKSQEPDMSNLFGFR